MIIGKIVPYLLLASFDLVVIVVVGKVLFGVPFVGNVATFALGAILFLMVTLGMGVFISTVSQNQGQAVQLAMMFVVPQVLLSGLIFPITPMATGVRWLAYVLPLSWFIDVGRGVMLKAAPITALVEATSASWPAWRWWSSDWRSSASAGTWHRASGVVAPSRRIPRRCRRDVGPRARERPVRVADSPGPRDSCRRALDGQRRGRRGRSREVHAPAGARRARRAQRRLKPAAPRSRRSATSRPRWACTSISQSRRTWLSQGAPTA